MIAEVVDITYHEFMQIIVEAILEIIQEEFYLTTKQLKALYERFMEKLLELMQQLLQAT